MRVTSVAHRRHMTLLALLVLTTAFIALVPSQARAAVFTPTRFDDPDPPGPCDPNDCSLREAINAANATVGVADEVVLKAGTYQLSIPGAEEDGGLNGDLDITNDLLTLTGQGSGATFIDGGGTATNERAIHVHSSATFLGLTVRNSHDDKNAGIWGGDESVVTLENAAVSGHTTPVGGYNSGIFSEGSITLTNSTVTGNQADDSLAGVLQWLDGTDGPLGPVTIRNSTIADNVATDGGSTGVYVQTELPVTIDHTTVTGNRSLEGNEAGVASIASAPLTLSYSIIADNVASEGRAGLYTGNSPNPVSVDHSLISGNQAPDGCCAGVYSRVPLTVTNTTISGNVALEFAAGLFHDAGDDDMTVNNVTVTGNRANSDGASAISGAGISENSDGTTRVRNTISFGNSDGSGGDDCFGEIVSQGHNIIGTTTGCMFANTTGDRIGVDPKLGPLADNGGPTMTHALLKGSPAINAGDPAKPGSGGTACEGTDQRGLPRKDCDIGAYERVLCGKVAVNRFGAEGNDKVGGTKGADGILGFGGKDKLNGKGGKDALCGGKGKDTLRGGGGKDTLRGEQGKDTCVGGPGKDKAKCEEEKKI